MYIRDTKLTILTIHEPPLSGMITAATLDQDKSFKSNNAIRYNSHRPHRFLTIPLQTQDSVDENRVIRVYCL